MTTTPKMSRAQEKKLLIDIARGNAIRILAEEAPFEHFTDDRLERAKAEIERAIRIQNNTINTD
jgi:hypothetical protein